MYDFKNAPLGTKIYIRDESKKFNEILVKKDIERFGNKNYLLYSSDFIEKDNKIVIKQSDKNFVYKIEEPTNFITKYRFLDYNDRIEDLSEKIKNISTDIAKILINRGDTI